MTLSVDLDIDAADLERRAAEGDADAQFDCGMALLAGERASIEGPRAIDLIERASDQEHAEAAAMSALFDAMGAARPQSWSRALHQLQRAAERGSTSAQGQLLTLAARGSTEPAPMSSNRNWADIRASISIDKLLAPPTRELLSDSPRIAVFSAFANEAECHWAIARARDRLKRATVFHTKTGGQTVDQVRDNTGIEFQLTEMDVVLEVLRARISAATRLPVPIFEPTQVLHYAVGEQFRPHHDFLDPHAPGFAEQLKLFGQRIATVLVYLNEDYGGGETVFPKMGISYRGRTGDALFFTNVDRTGQADPLTLHAGTPPTSGEKWIISQWIRDRQPTSPIPPGASRM